MKKDTEAIARLRVLVQEAGTQAAAAKQIGSTQGQVSDLLKGRRSFSNSILRRLGLRRVTVAA